MACLLSRETANELLFFLHSFCSGDLFKWRNHPYDVSGERLTQHILSEGEKKNTENCLKKITYYVLLKSC